MDKWLRKKAMDCIVWTAEEIEHHRSQKKNWDELWYEKDCAPIDEEDVSLIRGSALI